MRSTHSSRRRTVGLVVAVAFVAAACGGSGSSTATSIADEDAVTTSSPTDSVLQPSGTESTSEAPDSSIVETTIAGDPVESWRFPEIVSIDTSALLEQSERSSLAGPDSTYYWPDGNIGSVELDDGSVRYFAANGSRIARTRGSVGDLSAEVEATEQAIAGVPAEFPYAAGGQPSGDVASIRVGDGQLVIDADGLDPILTSPPLGLSTDEFVGVRITLSAQVAGVGQVFFTTDERTGIDEARSVRFDVSPGQSSPRLIHDMTFGGPRRSCSASSPGHDSRIPLRELRGLDGA